MGLTVLFTTTSVIELALSVGKDDYAYVKGGTYYGNSPITFRKCFVNSDW